MSIIDYSGAPLREGDHVEGWLDGIRYTATVMTIRAHVPGDGDFRRIVLIRDDDGTAADSFSDSVRVLSEKGN